MYKCSECGNEYDIMPKFCECGNDIFITVDDYVPQEIDDIDSEVPESRSRRNLRAKTFSPIAFAGFILCIILSLLIIFVIGNPKKSNTEIVLNDAQDEKIEIPSIDTFWDNTPPKISAKAQPKEENITDKIVEQLVPQPVKEAVADTSATKKLTETQEKSAPVVPKKTQIPSVPKVVQPQKQAASNSVAKTQPHTQNKTKVQTKTQTQQTTQQPMTFGDLTNKIRNQYYSNQNNNTAQTTKTSQTQNSLPASSAGQTTTKQSQSVAQTQNTKKTTSNKNQIQAAQTATQVTPVIPKKSEAQLKSELATYKSGLRNTIGRKIDFTRVIGDGECSLTFKLDSNGRLTSKAFSKQSSNITLNDAAFYALNTTVSYNPPPDGYKGETLKLYVKFYNGNFEIMLN